MSRSQLRSAFTLVELLVVMAVISILIGLGFHAFGVIRAKARIDNTRALVRSVASAISSYNLQWLSLQGTGGLERFRLWDVDGNHYLDGDPGAESFPALVTASGYQGFHGTIRPELPRWALRPGQEPGGVAGRIYDPWRQPLNIAFSVRAYGADGFGVWSTGPDGTGRFGAWDAEQAEAARFDPTLVAAQPFLDNLVSWEAR